MIYVFQIAIYLAVVIPMVMDNRKNAAAASFCGVLVSWMFTQAVSLTARCRAHLRSQRHLRSRRARCQSLLSALWTGCLLDESA